MWSYGSDADRSVSDADRSVSDADRSVSDADRSVSDADRTVSDDEDLPPPILQKRVQIPAKKLVKTEDTKKFTTKLMVHNALKGLTIGRKGVSLYAVKKYMIENYNVNTDKLNFYIKKAVKQGVETGEIVQTKGVGASGSFRLAPLKTKTEKKKKKTAETLKKVEMKKPEKKDAKKEKTATEKPKKIEKKIPAKESVAKPVKVPKVSKKDEEKPVAAKKAKTGKEAKKPTSSKTSKTSKMAKESETPVKMKRIIKRKSIGSIIKPPKMKPKAK